MASIERICERLRDGDARQKARAAIVLQGQATEAPAALEPLLGAIDDLPVDGDRVTRWESMFFLSACTCLTNYIRDSPNDRQLADRAARALLQLTSRPQLEISIAAAHWIGELGPAGRFGVDRLVELAQQEEPKWPHISLRAAAYRALRRVDLDRAVLLGDLPAKDEYIQALRDWMEDRRGSSLDQRLEAELAAATT